jgi:hypothetical protein
MVAVINHLHLNIPVDQLRTPLEQEFLPLVESLPGFHQFTYVRAAEHHAVVILLWANAEDAQHGAEVIVPGWFAQNVAPHLAREQNRYVGEAIVHYQV